MHVIVAEWRANVGQGDQVAELAREMTAHARQEPGCRVYLVNRHTDDPDRFLLYEVYDDEVAFEDHLASDAFRRIVIDRIVPLLADRHRETYHLVTPLGME